jgi:hypothetical protein
MGLVGRWDISGRADRDDDRHGQAADVVTKIDGLASIREVRDGQIRDGDSGKQDIPNTKSKKSRPSSSDTFWLNMSPAAGEAYTICGSVYALI